MKCNKCNGNLVKAMDGEYPIKDEYYCEKCEEFFHDENTA